MLLLSLSDDPSLLSSSLSYSLSSSASEEEILLPDDISYALPGPGEAPADALELLLAY